MEIEGLPGLRVLAIQGSDGRFISLRGIEGRVDKPESQGSVLRLERVGRNPDTSQEDSQGTVVFDSTVDAA